MKDAANTPLFNVGYGPKTENIPRSEAVRVAGWSWKRRERGVTKRKGMKWKMTIKRWRKRPKIEAKKYQ